MRACSESREFDALDAAEVAASVASAGSAAQALSPDGLLATGCCVPERLEPLKRCELNFQFSVPATCSISAGVSMRPLLAARFQS